MFDTSTTPTSFLYVSAAGSAAGDGSAANPFSTIQKAVDAATPGTAILVGAGIYVENVLLPTNGGTADAPIRLISSEGPGAAHIVAADPSASVIKGLGTDNYAVEGFLISGGKNGIQFSQLNNDFSNLVENVLIEGNLITGSAQDGIKVDQADGVSVVNNKVANVGDQAIDLLAVNNAVIGYNDASYVKGSSGAIMVKGGSTNVLIQGNAIHNTPGDGIVVGGYSLAQYFMPGASTQTEAGNVVVTGNSVSVALRAVNVVAGKDVTITGNYLVGNTRPAVSVVTGSTGQEVLPTPANITVTGNVFTRPNNLLSTAYPTEVTFNNNTTDGVWNGTAGPTDDATAEALRSPASLKPPASAYDLSALTFATMPGTSLGEVMKGGDGNEIIQGQDGNDTLTGGRGLDQLFGMGGDDTIFIKPGDGPKMINGGGGNDTLQIDRTGETFADVIDIRDTYGTDTLADGTTITKIEQIKFIGGIGDDAVYGGAGSDILYGGSGHNYLLGGGGNDWIRCNTGDDVDAGTGDDLIEMNGTAQFVNGGSGTDTLVFEGKVAPGMGTVRRVEKFLAGDGAVIDLTNFHMGVQLGLYGQQTTGLTVTGSSFADGIMGTGYDDTLLGGGGNDTLKSFGGNDLLTGGAGNDTLTGGDGFDTAVFSGKSSDYSVTVGADFTTVTDLRRLSPDGSDRLIGVEALKFADTTTLLGPLFSA